MELRGKEPFLESAGDAESAEPLDRIATQLGELTRRLEERDRELAAMRVELAHRDAQTSALAAKLAGVFAQVADQRRRAERAERIEAAYLRITRSPFYRFARAVRGFARRTGSALTAPWRAVRGRGDRA